MIESMSPAASATERTTGIPAKTPVVMAPPTAKVSPNEPISSAIPLRTSSVMAGIRPNASYGIPAAPAGAAQPSSVKCSARSVSPATTRMSPSLTTVSGVA